MHLRHRLANVKTASIQLKLEVLTKLFLKNFHLFRLLEFIVIAGQLRIAHQVLHKVRHEQLHLCVSAKLVV